jgi:hypothetical protein
LPCPTLGPENNGKIGHGPANGSFSRAPNASERIPKAHQISLELDQQVSPSTRYDGIPRRAKTAIPVKIRLKNSNHYPNYKQYPLKEKAKEGPLPIGKRFLMHGLLKPCQSPCNIPILSVTKPTGQYRMMQDLQLVNEAVIPIHPLVADSYTILSQISKGSKWFTVNG